MATFTKYQDTAEQFWRGTHQLHAAGHVVKAAIHSDAPTVATDDELADLTQVTGTGYTAGGEDTQNDMTESGGTATWTGVDVVWTAGASDWVAARYVSLHNDNSTTDKLLGAWDYGSNFTLLSGETFTLDFGASVATLT
jgi:hypothetical protein